MGVAGIPLKRGLMRWTEILVPVVALLLFLASAEASTDAAPGITERPGRIVPNSLEFRDESGNFKTFGALSNRPAIITLGYFSCRKLCEDTLAGVAGVVSKLTGPGARPGEDFVVLSFSFDALDTPEDAARKKNDYVKMAGAGFPTDAWQFLTGSAGNIEGLKEALGFSVKGMEGGFDHPAAIIVTAPGGKIIRYLYGTSQLPMDVKMALAEASEGRPGPTIPKALLFCYKYDPDSQAYVLDVLRMTGLGVLVSAAALLIYLTRSEKNPSIR